MGGMHDVVKTSNGDLVVATSDGLYHTDDAGNTINIQCKSDVIIDEHCF